MSTNPCLKAQEQAAKSGAAAKAGTHTQIGYDTLKNKASL